MASRDRKPRRWVKHGPHEYTLRMGPLVIEVTRWGPYVEMLDEWGFVAKLGHTEVAHGHNAGRKGAPLATCQADAIAAVERWRDAIR